MKKMGKWFKKKNYNFEFSREIFRGDDGDENNWEKLNEGIHEKSILGLNRETPSQVVREEMKIENM